MSLFTLQVWETSSKHFSHTAWYLLPNHHAHHIILLNYDDMAKAIDL